MLRKRVPNRRGGVCTKRRANSNKTNCQKMSETDGYSCVNGKKVGEVGLRWRVIGQTVVGNRCKFVLDMKVHISSKRSKAM